MPLARLGCTMVLSLKVLPVAGGPSDHMASESSPWLRRKLFLTWTPLALPSRLRPSAVVPRMRLFCTTRLLLLPVSHRPHFSRCTQIPETTELGPRLPVMKLSGEPSLRTLTSPKTAKSYSLVLPLALVWSIRCELCSTEYQLPAPRMVTPSAWMVEPSLKSPCGIQTSLPCDLAWEMVVLKALVESLTPVGSAPLATMDSELAGAAAAAATCSKSATSMVAVPVSPESS